MTSAAEHPRVQRTMERETRAREEALRWLASLPERERTVLMRRKLAKQNKLTLEAVGKEIGSSRQRVFQIEQETSRSLRETGPNAPSAASRRWMLSVAQEIGGGCPAPEAWKRLGGNDTAARILLFAMGSYEEDMGWLYRGNPIGRNQIGLLLTMAGTGGSGQGTAARKLAELGIGEEWHSQWLQEHKSLQDEDKSTADAKESRTTKEGCLLTLEELGQPATVAEIRTHWGTKSSEAVVRNALSNDPRFQRTGLKTWGLSNWNHRLYRNSTQTGVDILLAIGPSKTNTLVTLMANRSGISRMTARQTCYGTKFETKSGVTSLRHDEGPKRRDGHEKPIRKRGAFLLGERTVSIIIPVTRRLLGGNGTPIGIDAAVALRVKPGNPMKFKCPDEGIVNVSLPYGMGNSAHIGSVRTQALGRGAKEGDLLTVILDGDRESADFQVSRSKDKHRGWKWIRQAVGLKEQAGRRELADAMRCEPQNIEEQLRARGEREMLRALAKDKGREVRAGGQGSPKAMGQIARERDRNEMPSGK